MRIYIDIETIPSQQPGAAHEARKSVRPPASYKRAETIADWWATQGEDAAESAYRKTALDGAQGEICALGFASDDSQPVSLVRALAEPEGEFLRRALTALAEVIEADYVRGPDGSVWPCDAYFIGHNIGQFDLPFLWQRCIVTGFRPPFNLPPPTARHGKDYGDTMTAWAGIRGTIGLDRLCKALGIASPKDAGIDGSKVYDIWRAGGHEALARYNSHDVQAVREIWQRLNWEVGS